MDDQEVNWLAKGIIIGGLSVAFALIVLWIVLSLL